MQNNYNENTGTAFPVFSILNFILMAELMAIGWLPTIYRHPTIC